MDAPPGPRDAAPPVDGARAPDAAGPDALVDLGRAQDAASLDARAVDAQAPDAEMPDLASPDARPDAAPDAAPDAIADAAIDAAVVCVPTEETCDDLDNDCNGVVDNLEHMQLPCPIASPNECGLARWSCEVGAGATCRGTHTTLDAEACNNEDDNCNGTIDEGIDLVSNPEHCGRCNNRCDPVSHGRGLCSDRGCQIARCDDMYYDRNLDPGDGCEVYIPGEVLYVRTHGNDGNLGTQMAPLRTFAAANALADAVLPPRRFGVIDLGPGTFSGNETLSTQYLTVRGAGPGADQGGTTVSGSLLVTGDHVRIQDLEVDAEGLATGIELDCAQHCSVIGTTVEDVGTRSDPEFPEGPPVAAIRVTRGIHHLISGNHIRQVRGATPPLPEFSVDRGCMWGHGSTAAGILIETLATQSRLLSNRIEAVNGGDGSSALDANCNGGGLGALGGAAYGIYLNNDVGNFVVAGNRISAIVGGPGGAGQRGVAVDEAPPDANIGDLLRSPDGNGGGGGLAAGIRIEGSGSRLRGNIITDVRGGLGGVPGDAAGVTTGHAGPDAQPFGLFFHPYLAPGAPPPADPFSTLTVRERALDNDIDESNTYDGEPVLFCHGEPVEWTGLTLAGARAPTNLGRMVLIDCDQSTVTDNIIEGFVGATGRPSASTSISVPGGPAAGIFLLGTSDSTVSRNEIAGIEGGRGAQGAYDLAVVALLTTGGRGGPAAGIRLMDSHENLLSQNLILEIVGGTGGLGGLAQGNGGSGGRASGVELHAGSTSNELEENTIDWLSGGPGGPSGDYIDTALPDGPSGVAYGVFLGDDASTATRIDATNFYDGLPFAYFVAQPGVVADHLHYETCRAMTNLGQVVVLGSPRASLTDVVITCTPGEDEDRPSDLIGEPGNPGTNVAFGTNGSSYTGMRVVLSSDTTVSGLRIDNVAGGTGGPSFVALKGGEGGAGIGLYVNVSERFTLNDAHISQVRGGVVGIETPGFPGLPTTGDRGQASEAAGIVAFDSPGSVLANVLVTEVSSECWAIGIRLANAGTGPTSTAVRQATLVGVEGLNAEYCVDDNEGHFDYSSGVLVEGNLPSIVTLDNLVLADISNAPIHVFGGHRADRTALCYQGPPQVIQVGPGIPNGPLYENPMYLFRADSDPPFGLDARSVCVDLGAGPCMNERTNGPDPCITDVGYEGNTARGQVREQ